MILHCPIDKTIVANQTRFDFLTTGDGSPSICLSNDRFRPEAMHHSDGALAESLFIYHRLLAESLEFGAQPHVLSVGLGCAYNEMISVAHFLAKGISFTDFYMESFEGVTELREGFLTWLHPTGDDEGELQTELQSTFDKVLRMVGQQFHISPNQLKSKLLELYAGDQFKLRDWLTASTEFNKKFGVIYFDAFSNKSTPDIWGEAFLVNFLQNAADEKCGLATYASTGALKRALKNSGFTLAEQPGFSGKRQSTRALR